MRKLQKILEINGILILISVIPVAVSSIIQTDNAHREIISNYVSMPFWFFVSLMLILLSVCILYYVIKKSREIRSWIFVLPAAVLLLLGVFGVYSEVLGPLGDIPYLDDPPVVRLEDVRFYYNNTGDFPEIQLEGEKEDGKKERFSISYATYEQGQKLHEQADENSVAVDVEYLPCSKTVLNTTMWVEN